MLRILACVIPVVFGIIVTDPPPSRDDYKYSYSVEDPSTGDSKSQHEVRYGDTVSGAYSVLDPDGTKRTVEYTSHPRTGFKAVVKSEPSTPNQNPLPNYIQSPLVLERYTSILGAAYAQRKPIVHFTPDNELQQKYSGVKRQYFVPVNKYYTEIST